MELFSFHCLDLPVEYRGVFIHDVTGCGWMTTVGSVGGYLRRTGRMRVASG